MRNIALNLHLCLPQHAAAPVLHDRSEEKQAAGVGSAGWPADNGRRVYSPSTAGRVGHCAVSASAVGLDCCYRVHTAPGGGDRQSDRWPIRLTGDRIAAIAECKLARSLSPGASLGSY